MEINSKDSISEPKKFSDLLSSLGYDKVRHIFFIDPMGAVRMTRSDVWKTDPNHKNPKQRQRKAVSKYFAFKNKFTYLCKNANYKLENELNILFVIPMANSWSKKKKQEYLYTKHQQKPDLDNLCKAEMDSFGIDDSAVWKITATKVWGNQGLIIIL